MYRLICIFSCFFILLANSALLHAQPANKYKLDWVNDTLLTYGNNIPMNYAFSFTKSKTINVSGIFPNYKQTDDDTLLVPKWGRRASIITSKFNPFNGEMVERVRAEGPLDLAKYIDGIHYGLQINDILLKGGDEIIHKYLTQLVFSVKDGNGAYVATTIDIRSDWKVNNQNKLTGLDVIPISTDDTAHYYINIINGGESIKIGNYSFHSNHIFSHYIMCVDKTGNIKWINYIGGYDKYDHHDDIDFYSGFASVNGQGNVILQGQVWESLEIMGQWFDVPATDQDPYKIYGRQGILVLNAAGALINHYFFSTPYCWINVRYAKSGRMLFFGSFRGELLVGGDLKGPHMFENIFVPQNFYGDDYTISEQVGVIVAGEFNEDFTLNWSRHLNTSYLSINNQITRETQVFRWDIIFASNFPFVEGDRGEIYFIAGFMGQPLYLTQHLPPRKVFADSFVNVEVVLVKISRENGYEGIYRFGNSTEENQSKPMHSSILYKDADTFYMMFTPGWPGWRIENYLHSPAGGKGRYILARIIPERYYMPDSLVLYRQDCRTAELIIAGESTPDSTRIEWGDGSHTRGKLQGRHTYDSSGNFTITAHAWHKGEHWQQSISFTSVALTARMILAPDTVRICSGSAGVLRSGALPAGVGVRWSTGDTTASTTVRTAGWVRAHFSTPLGCARTDSVYVHVIAPLPENILADTLVCVGQAHTFRPRLPHGAVYSWQDGSTDSIFRGVAPFSVTLSVELEGCRRSYVATAAARDTLSRFAFKQSVVQLREGGAGYTVGVSARYGQVVWSDGSRSHRRHFNYGDTGAWWLRIENECQRYVCSLSLRGQPSCAVHVPNAFTPYDGDALNRYWHASSGCSWVSGYYLRIYNRWGSLVFSSNDSSAVWDGGGWPQDVYVWMLGGRLSNGEVRHLRGTLHLMAP